MPDERMEREKKIIICGYECKDAALIRLALTHRSLNETCNERLEFLGDSVLSLVITEHLYKAFPDKDEGDLSKMRTYLVREEALYECAMRAGLYTMLAVSKNEQKGDIRPSILADAMEAVFGAIYLDGGLNAARGVILDLLAPRLDNMDESQLDCPKTVLKELLAKQGTEDIDYEVYRETGPDHDKTFYVNVYINGQKRASGSGKSKRDAQQAAARSALNKLDKKKGQ